MVGGSAVRCLDVDLALSRIERDVKVAHSEVTRVFIEAQSFEAHRRALEEAGDPIADVAR